MILTLPFVTCVSACSTGGCHVGAGRAPSAGETPAVQTAAQRPVLHAETPAAQEAWKGTGQMGDFLHMVKSSLIILTNSDLTCFESVQNWKTLQNNFFLFWILPSSSPICWCLCYTGDGADAALQPASDRGDEEQTDAGESQAAEDSAQRSQDPHGHVQEKSSHHRSCHHSRAGEGEGQTGEKKHGL